jgi:hypothetical protein
MNRLILPNPDADGYSLFRLNLNGDELAIWFGKTGVGSPPPGFAPYVTLVGSELTIGIRRESATSPAVKPADLYDKMSDADLRSRCGMKGVACTADDNRTALLAKLRKGK